MLPDRPGASRRREATPVWLPIPVVTSRNLARFGSVAFAMLAVASVAVGPVFGRVPDYNSTPTAVARYYLTPAATIRSAAILTALALMALAVVIVAVTELAFDGGALPRVWPALTYVGGAAFLGTIGLGAAALPAATTFHVARRAPVVAQGLHDVAFSSIALSGAFG